MTAPAAPLTAAEKARLTLLDGLDKAVDGARARPLAEVVAGNLLQLWEQGGRRGKTQAGQQPQWIRLRPQFMIRPADDPRGPLLPQLVKRRGLQLRLELLLLFDAHCRHAPDETVRNVRKVTPRADDEYTSWRQMVLTPSTPGEGSDQGPGALRSRQITEAFLALEQQHLVWIPRAAGGRRRQYDELRLLSEASTPEEHPHYTVPATGVRISPHLFTNLWVFALTDTELATYLALARQRARYPYRHATEGIYLRGDDRKNLFRLTRPTWRATDMLHRYGLVDRVKDPQRNFRTGKVGDFANRWAKGEVMPVHYKINDEALGRPALATIRQVLTAPTDADRARRAGEELILGLEDVSRTQASRASR